MSARLLWTLSTLLLTAGMAAGPAAALPGSYSMEAYGPNGERRFAGGYSYFNRIYSERQARFLDFATRDDLVYLREACKRRFRLSRHDLGAIRAHWRAGHTVLFKQYLGYSGGVRNFATVCAVRPGALTKPGQRSGTGAAAASSAPAPAVTTKTVEFRDGRPVVTPAPAAPGPATTPPAAPPATQPPEEPRRFVVIRDGRPVAE